MFVKVAVGKLRQETSIERGKFSVEYCFILQLNNYISLFVCCSGFTTDVNEQ
jgi:hypothetical protein